jgi:5-methylcytosine-specific restriction endonuclease McrA
MRSLILQPHKTILINPRIQLQQGLYRRTKEGQTMPMQRNLYPDNWDEIAVEVKESTNWTCQNCGKQCLFPGIERYEAYKRDRTYWAINTLTVHHIDHTPANCDRTNLIALCAPCHRRQHARDKKYGIPNPNQLAIV